MEFELAQIAVSKVKKCSNMNCLKNINFETPDVTKRCLHCNMKQKVSNLTTSTTALLKTKTNTTFTLYETKLQDFLKQQNNASLFEDPDLLGDFMLQIESFIIQHDNKNKILKISRPLPYGAGKNTKGKAPLKRKKVSAPIKTKAKKSKDDSSELSQILKTFFQQFSNAQMPCASQTPLQISSPKVIDFGQDRNDIVDQEVSDLLRLGAISQCEHEEGHLIDSVEFKVYLPDEKIEKMLKACSDVITATSCGKLTIRNVAHLIGLFTSARNAVRLSALFFRFLNRDKVDALEKNNDNFYSKMSLSNEETEIKWWQENINIKNGKDIRPSKHDQPGATENPRRSGENSYSYCTNVGNTTMVPSFTRFINFCTQNVTKHSKFITTSSQQPITCNKQESLSSRLYCIRNYLKNKGLSEHVIKLICKSWRNSTSKQYDLVWNKWIIWCNKRKINPCYPSESQILSYLSDLAYSGKSYSVINTHKSAISQTLSLCDNEMISCSTIISRFMKGIYVDNPPKPK
ncbi:unnamed protein product [Mytilus coruscus]|uniref:Uncharacterized protein n=1 Tax=Mytilus coruscus TaxID=42192 RepID=A0A6J8AIK9_MYTCO|nr:unnamed protein product [Mytilus coruscus]